MTTVSLQTMLTRVLTLTDMRELTNLEKLAIGYWEREIRQHGMESVVGLMSKKEANMVMSIHDRIFAG